MILILQTNIEGRLDIWLVDRKRRLLHQAKISNHPIADQTLNVVAKLLQKNNLQPRHLRGIIVVRGPGRFSAVRVGILIANALSNELGIPAIGITKNTTLAEPQILQAIEKLQSSRSKQPVRPWYGKKPNISRPKKR